MVVHCEVPLPPAKGNAGFVLQRGLDVGSGRAFELAPVLDRGGGVRVAFTFDGDGFELGRFLRLAGSGKERQREGGEAECGGVVHKKSGGVLKCMLPQTNP